MSQKTKNFLDLALDDYRAARLLLRQGLLAQGAAVAATAVEKELKAVLALKAVYTKKHIDAALLTLACTHFPQLKGAISEDFIKFLRKAFTLRYATIDGAGFGIVINQHRTLIELDVTIMTIDSGLKLSANGVPHPTPLTLALQAGDPFLIEDNVPLKQVTFENIARRPNKMLEMKVGQQLDVMHATYQTEGLNVRGDFCKRTDVGSGKTRIQLALG